MEELDLVWLAGLLEGEGSFLKPVPSRPNSPIISCAMTDEDVIARVASLFGVKYHKRPGIGWNRKDFWSVRTHGNPAIELMILLRPLMGKRRKSQIDAALDCEWPKKRTQKRCGTLYSYRMGCRCSSCSLVKHEEYLRRKS